MTGKHSRISYQDAVIEDVTMYANRAGERVMTEYRYSNTGRLVIGSTTRVVLTIDFDFQSGSKNMLLINGAKHGPPGPDNYYFTATETERYAAFIARLRFLLCRDRHEWVRGTCQKCGAVEES